MSGLESSGRLNNALPKPYERIHRFSAAGQIIPVIDHLGLILGNTLNTVIPSLSLKTGVGRELVEGRIIESFSVHIDNDSVQPPLEELMAEFPGILHALGGIHHSLVTAAAADLDDPPRAPTVTARVRAQADMVHVAILDQVEERIIPSVRRRLAELGIADSEGLRAEEIAFSLVQGLTNGSFWSYDRSGVISPEAEKDLEELLGHPIAIDWLSAALEGKIPA